MTVTVGFKKRVIVRDGGLCQLMLPGCTGEAQTADHRANRGAGGSTVLDHPSNLVAACSLCNGAKETVGEGARRWLVRRGLRVVPDSTHEKTAARAAQTLVKGRDDRWYLLVDADTRIPVVVPSEVW